jgi:hypothetical protein
MSTACSGGRRHSAMVWTQSVTSTDKGKPTMTTPLFIVICLTTGLTIAMLADLFRDLSGRNE